VLNPKQIGGVLENLLWPATMKGQLVDVFIDISLRLMLVAWEYENKLCKW
jgi:hypothetical protein